jgi:hypothetical protein
MTADELRRWGEERAAIFQQSRQRAAEKRSAMTQRLGETAAGDWSPLSNEELAEIIEIIERAEARERLERAAYGY